MFMILFDSNSTPSKEPLGWQTTNLITFHNIAINNVVIKAKAQLNWKERFLLFDMYLLQPGIFCKSVMQARDADPHLIT